MGSPQGGPFRCSNRMWAPGSDRCCADPPGVVAHVDRHGDSGKHACGVRFDAFDVETGSGVEHGTSRGVRVVDVSGAEHTRPQFTQRHPMCLRNNPVVVPLQDAGGLGSDLGVRFVKADQRAVSSITPNGLSSCASISARLDAACPSAQPVSARNAGDAIEEASGRGARVGFVAVRNKLGDDPTIAGDVDGAAAFGLVPDWARTRAGSWPAMATTQGPSEDGELIDAARAARERAYAPYSKFTMGAAVRCADGKLVTGALVENVSLGLAMCAERVALFAAVANGSPPVALALVSDRTDGELTFPCGACLQVALELGGPDLAVTVSDLDGSTGAEPLRELLPRAPRARQYDPS